MESKTSVPYAVEALAKALLTDTSESSERIDGDMLDNLNRP